MSSMDAVKVVVYVTDFCPYCDAAKRLLEDKSVDYQTINVNENPELRDEIIARSGRRTLPQIFINDQSIGGFDDLRELERLGELDRRLQG